MNLRALPLIGLLSIGCFGTAPTLETDADASSSAADSTGATPMCQPDELPLPTVPEGWEGPAWVAIGTGTPLPPCPEATVGQLMFLETPASPQCACTCDVAACGTTYSVGDGCDAVMPQGALNLCADLALPSEAIDLSVTPGSPTCVATPTPFGGSAMPVLACTIVGVGDGCADSVPGFAGPCIVGDGDACPQGFTELVGEATALQCEPCAMCDSSSYCDDVTYEVFEGPGCEGMPVGGAKPKDNCVVVGTPFASIRAVEQGRLETGCEPAAAVAEPRRICCVTE